MDAFLSPFGPLLVPFWFQLAPFCFTVGIISMFSAVLEANIAKHGPMKLMQTIVQDPALFDWFNGVKCSALPTTISKQYGVSEAKAGSKLEIQDINFEPHRGGQQVAITIPTIIYVTKVL